jgi:hypothetical protein
MQLLHHDWTSSPTQLIRWTLGFGHLDGKISHATYVKNHALASVYETKEHVLANGTARNKPRTSHVQMSFGKVPF